MPTLVHIIQNCEAEGPGCLLDWAKARKHEVQITRVYEGEELPFAHRGSKVLLLGSPIGEWSDPWVHAQRIWIQGLLNHIDETETKILGICFGAQLLAHLLGARVDRAPFREVGWHPVFFDFAGTDLSIIKPKNVDLFQWHSDQFSLPDGAIPIARSEACPLQGFIFGKNVMALAGHLEMNEELIEKFIHEFGPNVIPGDSINRSLYGKSNQYTQTPEQIRALSTESLYESRRFAFELLDGFFGR